MRELEHERADAHLTGRDDSAPARPADVIGSLLDRAVRAMNDGDLVAAHDLAGQVLAEDAGNREASQLLATEQAPGELRRLTLMACDLVGSTELSERLDLERYRIVIRTYQRQAREIIETRYGGHVDHLMGDGLFSLFGYPTPHEEDAVRAVHAALDICTAVGVLSDEMHRAIGGPVSVRAAVHRGLVFIDSDSGEVYGLAANVVARLQAAAAPGEVVISREISRLVADRFTVEPGGQHIVRGVTEPLDTFRVLSPLPSRPRRRSVPLIGREPELAVLRGAWASAGAGAPGRALDVLLSGEPGVGKSRLAAALADDVRTDRGVVIELAGSSLHADAGFHPLKRLIESRCGITAETSSAERLTRLRAELAVGGLSDALGLLAPVLDLPPDAGYEATLAEGRKLGDEIAAAAKRYVLACFGGGSGMLLAEDVQWFDESTLALVRGLQAERPPELVIVLTSRPGGPLDASTTLELGALSPAACLELVDALAGGEIDPGTMRAVVERSDGVPLYLEELLQSGVLLGEDDPGAVPDVLYEALVARVYTTARGVPVAAAAATIGRTVDLALLERAVDLGAGELADEVRALVRSGVLDEVEAGRLRFHHELLREVAYELQPPAERQAVHARVADLLVEGAPDVELADWGVVASHYAHARRESDAAEAFAHAADQARWRGAIAEARLQLGRAIDMILELPDDRDRMQREVDLRLRRGFLAMSVEAVGSPDAAADYARCLELAMHDASGDEMFSTLISLWAYYLSRAELDRARQVSETLRAALSGGREYFQAANTAGFGMIKWFEGDFLGGHSLLEEAVAELSPDGDHANAVWFVPNDPTASMHTHLALARFMAGDTAGADAALARSAAVTRELPFPQGPWSRAYAQWLGAWMRCERGRWTEAAAASEAVVELAGRHGFDGWAMIGMTQKAAVAATLAAGPDGSPPGAADAAATLGSFTDLWLLSELRVFLPYYLTAAAAALTAAGDRAGARARCEDALALSNRTGMRFYDAETMRRLALLGDDEITVTSGLEAALRLARGQGARPFELRTALDLDERGAAGGRAALARAVAAFAPDADLDDLSRARARLSAER